jgi:predicted DNA-binding transcriptional regulator YafY
MRASRLLSILILLQLRVRLTADALAREFEVSVRTIYRDIDKLSAAGVPIYGDRGPGGGFQLIDGYQTRLTGLATDEAEAMFMIGMPGPAAALGLGDAAVSAGRKLLAALPREWRETASKMNARFHVDPVDWYRGQVPLAHLPALVRAVLDCRIVTMQYTSWSGERAWRVEPLGLVMKAGAWYLVARGAGSTRIFKVSNMAEHRVLDEFFLRPVNFDLPAYWTNELIRFEAQLRTESATIKASALGLKRLAELGEYAERAVAAAVVARTGRWTTLSLPIENVEHAARMLLGLGPEIEVIAPLALRHELGKLASQIARRAR